jgi:hypothetical protein
MTEDLIGKLREEAAEEAMIYTRPWPVICDLLLQAAEALSAAPVQAVDREIEVAAPLRDILTTISAMDEEYNRDEECDYTKINGFIEDLSEKADAILSLFSGKDGLLRHTCGDEGPVALAATEDLPSAAAADRARLDFLDACNRRLNERYGTNYGWKLILNHNVTRLMLNDHQMSVDLHDSEGGNRKLPSCRDAIDERMREFALAKAHPPASEKTEGGEG